MIAAVSIARPLRAAIHATGRRERAVNGVIHEPGPARPDELSTDVHVHRATGRRAQADAAARPRIERPDLPVEARQHQAPADELDRRDDVRVRDPPGDLAVGLERERLDLGLDDDVGEPRRPEHRQDRRRGPVAPAQLARARDEPVRVEAVLDDEQPLGVPEHALGLVADRRGEADGPRAGRRLDADLRPAAGVRIGAGELAQVGQRAAGLRQREDRRRAAAAHPAKARPEAAGERDDRVLRLGGDHDRRSGAGVLGDGDSSAAAGTRLARR